LKTQKLQITSHAVNPLIEECIDTLRPIAGKREIELRFSPAPPSAQVFCDDEAMHQVMMNLLDNAIKYTPERGVITVSAQAVPDSSQGEMIEIGVRDSGQGIPADDLPRLFERFYRVDKARSRALGGTGLGLAIVKHLVRSMGGDVRVQSIVNEGSTFSFTLPVSDVSGVDAEPAHDLLTD
jgi:two-component system phosphate regulon sensor histidine kinase PhoR